MSQLNSQIAHNTDPKDLLTDVRRAVAPEASSPVSRVVVPRSDSKSAVGQDRRDTSKEPSLLVAAASLGQQPPRWL